MIIWNDFMRGEEILDRIYDISSEDDNAKAANPEDQEELDALLRAVRHLESYSGDSVEDALLIPFDQFTEYCKDLVQDCGDVPRNLPVYIAVDWDQTAKNMSVDYEEIEITGVSYYYR
jgi:hypothetical protein